VSFSLPYADAATARTDTGLPLDADAMAGDSNPICR
jgi:hypothetical protein